MSKYVKPSKDMDDATFVKHFNARHMPLAGLAKTHESMTKGVIDTMRAYHKRVHRSGVENSPNDRPVNHEHRRKTEPEE